MEHVPTTSSFSFGVDSFGSLSVVVQQDLFAAVRIASSPCSRVGDVDNRFLNVSPHDSRMLSTVDTESPCKVVLEP